MVSLNKFSKFCNIVFTTFFLFIYKRFMPVARVTHNSKVLIQNVQPKDEEKMNK